eukprot:TRINITY_DN5697_c0_g1_i1.p1 TRINITY_DN5697_c0_g1~~TRINITY_DN5697_c0_g1_i1.p1  ORF type:complete len:215 (-),score=47.28 TRINITY_DN5697_c0_g1_i1:302-946(-)
MSTHFKIIIIGDPGVGKSCLTQRACLNVFDQNNPPTMGADFHLYTTVLKNGQQITAQIWDTAGQEIYAELCRAYYKGANGVIICYDITSRRSYERVVEVWLKSMQTLCEQGIPSVLVGTKADLTYQRAISENEAKEFASDAGFIGHMETSSKTASHVTDCFDWIVEEVCRQQDRLLADTAQQRASVPAHTAAAASSSHGFKLPDSRDKQKKSCC